METNTETEQNKRDRRREIREAEFGPERMIVSTCGSRHVMEYNFGPKTPKEETIFARETARVDREVAEYESSWRCKCDNVKRIARELYWKIYDKVHYVISNDVITDWFHYRAQSIKFFWQRLTRGFDDSAMWSLDIHLAGLILPRLKRFKEHNTHTYPNGLTPEEWDVIIDKMIFSFEYTLDDGRMFGKFDEAEYEKAKEGLALFGQYFHALWD